MKNFKALLTLLLFVSLSSAYSMECSTPRGEVEFKLEDQKITFYQEKEVKRSLASEISAAVFQEGNSVTQYFHYEGVKHLIHVQNTKRPNAHEDYLLLSNSKGEKMLYPLDCKA